MINTEKFSADLKRALTIAPPQPADLEVIGSVPKSNPSASFERDITTDWMSKNTSGNKVVYIVAGIVITGLVAYGVYKIFIEPKQNKAPVTNSNLEIPVVQTENVENDKQVGIDSNNSTQDFFTPAINNSSNLS